MQVSKAILVLKLFADFRNLLLDNLPLLQAVVDSCLL